MFGKGSSPLLGGGICGALIRSNNVKCLHVDRLRVFGRKHNIR